MSMPDPSTPTRILLVEDDPMQAAIICGLLEEHGYALDLATTLADGRAAIRAGAPDLLLLDRLLPDGDGIDFCEELKGRPETRGLPIILVTALDRIEARVQGLLRGADEYLPKPFHPQELLARVHSCLRSLNLQRELHQQAEELAKKNEALLATQARLIQSERFAAIGEVSLAIRHEVNNALGTILGYTDLLLLQAEAMSVDGQRKLEAVRRAALRVRDVMRRLEGLRDDRTVEYIPGINMTDLREEGGERKGGPA
jgi:DNA-binding response OmpR family regulator